MAVIQNLKIRISPFNLDIVVDGSATELRLRETEVFLPTFSIADADPHNPVCFTDVLEAVCRQLAPAGLLMSFSVEPHETQHRVKRIELSKTSGRLLGHGQQMQGHSNATDQIWHWSAMHDNGISVKHPTGIALEELDGLPIAELRRVEFNFGVTSAR